MLQGDEAHIVAAWVRQKKGMEKRWGTNKVATESVGQPEGLT